MIVTVERLIGWDKVLNDARITVGKVDLNREPSDEFKKSILISEHSPIRKLMFEVTWEDMPYWVGMHFRTHKIGFLSCDEDIFFVQTQRSDRTQQDRDKLPQDAPIRLRAILNAQSIINVSRVRVCRMASKETREAWQSFIDELKVIEPLLATLCVPNCIYRGGFCPEGSKGCGYVKSKEFAHNLKDYYNFCTN